jgi:hypothetical protein
MKIWAYIIFFTVGCLLEVNAALPPRLQRMLGTTNSCSMSRSKFTSSDLVEYRFGLVAGRNLSKIHNDDDIAMNELPGIFGGLAAQIIWPGGFTLQPQIIYTQKGCTFVGHFIEYKIDYIQTPVKVMYRLQLADIRPFVFAVPYAAYIISQVEDLEVADVYLLSNQVNMFDYGVGAGAGFDIWRVQLSFNYTWGLAQVTHNTFTTRNRTFTISAGVFF